MRKRLMVATILLSLALLAVPGPADADILESAGNVLKKGAEAGKNLLQKGVDGIKSLFGGGSGSVDKLASQMKALDESQRVLVQKQENLVAYFNGPAAQSAAATPYVKERIRDLEQAHKANEKAYADLKANLEALLAKDTDLKEYEASLHRLQEGQNVVNQYDQKLSAFIPALREVKADGTVAESEAGKEEVSYGSYSSKDDNPTTAQDESEQTVDGGATTTGGSAGVAPGAGTAAANGFNPDDAKVLAIMDEWLGAAGLDPWGRSGQGLAHVQLSPRPDTNLGRGSWLWANCQNSTAGLNVTLGEYVRRRLQGEQVALIRPAAPAVVTQSGTPTLAASNQATKDGVSQIQQMMQDGQGQSDEMKAVLERYRQLKAERDAQISAGTMGAK